MKEIPRCFYTVKYPNFCNCLTFGQATYLHFKFRRKDTWLEWFVKKEYFVFDICSAKLFVGLSVITWCRTSSDQGSFDIKEMCYVHVTEIPDICDLCLSRWWFSLLQHRPVEWGKPICRMSQIGLLNLLDCWSISILLQIVCYDLLWICLHFSFLLELWK